MRFPVTPGILPSALRASLPSWALAEFETAEALGCDVPNALSGQAFANFRMERFESASMMLAVVLPTMDMSSSEGWPSARRTSSAPV